MTVTALGEITIAVALPGVSAGLATAMADIQAKVAAMAAFAPVPPSITTSLQITAEMTANLTLAASIGIEPPSLDVQVALMLEALAVFQAQLAILNELYGWLTASVHLYRYDGPVSALGTELQAELSGGLPGGSGADTAFALLFAATASPAILAMQAIFKSA